jgi:hypothetical protein
VTLGDDAAVRVEDRDFIGAVPCTVLTPDTAWVVMKDNAVVKFDVTLCRTALETLGVDTVVTAHGVEELESVGELAHLHLTHTPPLNISWVSVLFVTCNFTAVAAYASSCIEVKAVLLSGFKLWDVDGVVPALHTGVILVVDEAL